jgi:hypothetical protein
VETQQITKAILYQVFLEGESMMDTVKFQTECREQQLRKLIIATRFLKAIFIIAFNSLRVVIFLYTFAFYPQPLALLEKAL